MTPSRIAELRAAGVLDGPPMADAARIALLDLHARSMRIAAANGNDPSGELRYVVEFYTDLATADTPRRCALRWAREQARGAKR